MAVKTGARRKVQPKCEASDPKPFQTDKAQTKRQAVARGGTGQNPRLLSGHGGWAEKAENAARSGRHCAGSATARAAKIRELRTRGVFSRARNRMLKKSEEKLS